MSDSTPPTDDRAPVGHDPDGTPYYPMTVGELGLCGHSDDPELSEDAARHTPLADDLAAAERLCRTRTLPGDARGALDLLLAEYDRRGAELAQATFANQQHWDVLAGMVNVEKSLRADRDVLSGLLRGMARRAGEQRRQAREEYIGRQIAEQNLRYAPISGIEAYRGEVSAALMGRKPIPPVPAVIRAADDPVIPHHSDHRWWAEAASLHVENERLRSMMAERTTAVGDAANRYMAERARVAAVRTLTHGMYDIVVAAHAQRYATRRSIAEYIETQILNALDDGDGSADPALDGPADPGLSPAPKDSQTLDGPAEAPAEAGGYMEFYSRIGAVPAAGPAEAAEPTQPEWAILDPPTGMMAELREELRIEREIAAEAGAPEPSDWICDTCGARRGEHEGKDHAFFIFQGNGPAGSVTITPPEPGYQRIADAIQQLCEESAEVQIQLRPTKAGVTEWIGDQYLRLAQILDRAGLIDWTAFQDSPLPKETQQ